MGPAEPSHDVESDTSVSPADILDSLDAIELELDRIRSWADGVLREKEKLDGG